MKLPPEKAGSLRAWLDRDPVGWAHVIHLAFFAAGDREIWVDDPTDPEAVAVLHRGRERLVVAAQDPDRLGPLLEELPRGTHRLASLDLDLAPAVEEVLTVDLHTPVWLFRMDREDLVPHRVCETEPVRPESARYIARVWHPDRDAEDYVRGRIEEGITAGIYRDGRLVAWDMTHFETDRVVMLGFLHVLRPYRGRGYAKTVTTATCRQVFAREKVAASQVFEDNEPSLNLTEAMGFRRVKRQAWGEARKA